MEGNITCDLCGGNDFYKESGFYYCNECQTQNQNIREHVFEIPDEITKRRSGKKIHTNKKKTENKLTSWECYNYILLGLINELIELGADSKLKQVVHALWFKYLQKLEVLEDKPKLCALNSKKDAEIVYGRYRKKRKRSISSISSLSSSSESATTVSLSTLSNRSKSKLRSSYIQKKYAEYTNNLQFEQASLQNQSLSSLRSGSDSLYKEKFLRYNREAKKVLSKLMSKNHLKLHCRDVDCMLDCHKIIYKNTPNKYFKGPQVLSRNKIYALLYLGLLIIKDKIQLGDMIRFIREGSLSYHNVYHFFPEEFSRKTLNIRKWNANQDDILHSTMRSMTARIAKYIGVVKYIPLQNLIQLCQRYCMELNLPDEIWGYTINLMSKIMPALRITSHTTSIPNYEGRTIGMIMFVLKLLFSLDDVTEHNFSTYANDLNLANGNSPTMFSWDEWAYYISYRKLVLMQHHFPSQYLFDNENLQDTDTFLSFNEIQNSKHENDDPVNNRVAFLQRILRSMCNKEPSVPEQLEFYPSFTPFRAYIDVLVKSDIPEERNYLIDVLNLNFKEHSLDFLVNPIGHLEQLNTNRRIGMKYRNANKNMKMININNTSVKRDNWRNRAKRKVVVKIGRNKNRSSYYSFELQMNLEKNMTEKSSEEILKNFERYYLKSNRRSTRKLIKRHNLKKQKSNNSRETTQSRSAEVNQFLSSYMSPSLDSQETSTAYHHYNPQCRYWLKSLNLLHVRIDEFDAFIERCPNSFKLVLNECARIAEQQAKDMYNEFIIVEIYLCYVAKFSTKNKNRHKIVNNALVSLIKKAIKNW